MGEVLQIQAPVAGVMTWLDLFEDPTRSDIELLEGGSFWPIRSVKCAGLDSESETPRFANVVDTRLTPETDRYSVWMEYPRNGSKVPWGEVARGVSFEVACTFAKTTTRRMHIELAPRPVGVVN